MLEPIPTKVSVGEQLYTVKARCPQCGEPELWQFNGNILCPECRTLLRRPLTFDDIQATRQLRDKGMSADLASKILAAENLEDARNIINAHQEPWSQDVQKPLKLANTTGLKPVTVAPNTFEITPYEGWQIITSVTGVVYHVPNHKTLMAMCGMFYDSKDNIPDDVRRLVIAGRIFAYEEQTDETHQELNNALGAFAARIPWDDDPNDEETEDENDDK